MAPELVQSYLLRRKPSEVDPSFLIYVAALERVADVSPETARSIVQELADQRSNIKLIASENYSSLAVQSAMANLLTDKYAEGHPFHRFYAGCDNVDNIEDHACKKACELFQAEHAYVQPHSGADANIIAYWAILGTRVELPAVQERGVGRSTDLSQLDWEVIRQRMANQRLLGMDLTCGGHLTHGMRGNVSAKMFDTRSYVVNRETGLLDYDEIAKLARRTRPLILLAGYSAYPRSINFRLMREIADDVGAVLMVDMAHFAGLVAGGVFRDEFDPVPYSHVVTSTTHKTLRGPRGGLVLCTAEFQEQVDKGCPMVQGGPLPHVIAAKAVCFTEALRPEFKEYAQKIVQNARSLAEACLKEGMSVVSGGTDNHLVLLEVTPYGLTGRQAESALRDSGITLNRNTIPFDPNGAWYTSGLRLGTPAVTTLGMGESEMQEIASVIHLVLSNTTAGTTKDGKQSKARYQLDEATQKQASSRIEDILRKYPVYPEIDLSFLRESFGL
ncbi:MAG: glycine hydroxymethyltransferase [Phycisphaerales bacterium]|nr:MAG: glycine hydroxymethyltransferase [Phycisphaerales bacterium]